MPTTAEPSLTEAELLEAGRVTYQAFLSEEAAMYEELDYDFTRLSPFTSDEVATAAVAAMQDLHESGINLRGTPSVAAVVVIDPEQGGVARIDACVDARAGTAYSIETGEVRPPTSTQVTPWRLTMSVSPRGVMTLTDQESLDSTNSAVCASVS